ncbi:MAG TPA: hypothetical protein DCG57_00035 [Candidatus Riflebacteria bacterium]|nr:hypothetical protein [Candidatus Riflebacteria bacterium]
MGKDVRERKIYSMLNDFAFQWLFNRPGQEKLTISLLNAILQLDSSRRIEELELLNPFHPRRFRDQKLTIVDVKARDKAGRWYCIEAQVHRQDAFVSRTAFYVASLYRDQAKAGSDYVALMPATCIAILDFDLFRQSKHVHEAFEFRNADGTLALAETMALHYIDLTKYDINKPRKLQSAFEKWLNLMKFSETYGKLDVKIPGALTEEEPINMAIKELQKINADEKMRRRMADREKEALDLAIIKGAVYNKGKEVGKIEGRTEGRAEGRAEEKFEIAKKMLALNADIEFIKQATDLTDEELQKLT